MSTKGQQARAHTRYLNRMSRGYSHTELVYILRKDEKTGKVYRVGGPIGSRDVRPDGFTIAERSYPKPKSTTNSKAA